MTDCYAFIDESGHRAITESSSKHFIMAAVIVDEASLPRAHDLLASIRANTGRGLGHRLKWEQVDTHAQRIHIAQSVGLSGFLTISAVIVCKRFLTGLPDHDLAYLYTYRFLLERLSWIARQRAAVMHATLAHIQRFRKDKLRAYEAKLRMMATSIEWAHLDPLGTRIDQDTRQELLQLADSAASAIACAFEPDRYGNTERRYLRELFPCVYKRAGRPITSYGLKVHPWNEETKAEHAWLSRI